MAGKNKAHQRDTADLVIEDPALEADLEILFDYDPEPYRQYLQASKRVKDAVQDRHPNAINSDADGEHTGAVICGQYAFYPRAANRPEKSKTTVTREGLDWKPLSVKRLGL